MKTDKENERIIDDFDYLSNAASAQECTGLIPFLPTSEEELEAYNDVYQYRSPLTSKNRNYASSGKVSSEKPVK